MRLAIFWIASAGLLVLLCGVTDCAQQDGDKKDLYLMHLSMEVLRSRTMPHMMAFIVEMVNNDTRLLPGYTLHIINGFSQKSVSLALCRVQVTHNACRSVRMIYCMTIIMIYVYRAIYSYIYTILFLRYVCLSVFANCRSQFLHDCLGRCL